MSSACLLLCVLVVVCCLLWRNAKRYVCLLTQSANELFFSNGVNFRQAKDRYYDGGGSLKDYPSTLGMHQMDNFSAIGSHITNNSASHHKHMQQETMPILSRAPSAMDAGGMTGTMQSHLSQPSTVMMPNGMIAPINGPLPTASGVPQLLITAPSVSTLPGANPSLFGYPSQPLPPVPAPQVAPMQPHHPPQQIVNGMKRNMSTDSFHHDESSGRGTDSSSGRPSTPPLKTSRPVTPVQQLPPQPLGLPSNRAKLVPGRMSNHKLDANNSRPGSRREIPSTAV